MVTMTATCERVKRVRPKPARSMRLSPPVHGNGARLLVLNVGKVSVGYHLLPLPCDFGRGFRLEKFTEGGGDEDENTYLVNVDTATGNTECSCKGNAYRGSCKHADALARLIADRKL
jgi:hypothetical protein